MARLATISECAGHRVLESKRYYVPGDVLHINGDAHKLGDVYSYSISYGEDPVLAGQKAAENGHAVYWLNRQPVCITAHQRQQETRFFQSPGDIIQYCGKKLQIVAAQGGHFTLEVIA